MPRSRVRAGAFDARDRATKRRRERHAVAPATPPPDEALRVWIEGRLGDLSCEELERVDIDAYVRDSDHFEVEPTERLRLLAVKLEDWVHFKSPLRNWQAVDRVYQRAIRWSPRNPWAHASRGISAASIAELAEAEVAVRLNDQARSALLRAAELDPADAQIVYALGYAVYVDHRCSQSEALAHFDKALGVDPSHAWALLYRAHCLHDLERWEEAAEAYSAVPKAAFVGPPSWRMDLLIKQRGFCRLMAGDEAGALADFETILGRYEKQPHLATWTMETYLKDAAEQKFPQLIGRVKALEEKVGDALEGSQAADLWVFSSR